MRNNINIAGFSEMVHETRGDAAEAWFGYVVEARHSPGRGITASVGPAMLGTVKSSRRYSLAVSDSAPADATPMDLALTGVAACSLITLIAGGSAKGLVFDNAEMRIQHHLGVSCHFEVDGPDEHVLAELLDKVQNFSPNHRTLAEPVPLDLTLADRSGRVQCASITADAPTAVTSAVRQVRWISGAQFESHAVDTAGSVLRIDQPKPTGVDWGPNPQEYLLMGLASDIAATLARDLGGLEWTVTARGGVDIRGLLQSAPAVPVGLQGLACTVTMLSGDGFDAALSDAVTDAVSRSRVAALIGQPQAIDVSAAFPQDSTPRPWRGRAPS
ncbi:MAG: hypothetical protein QOF58_4366 [Pseudonocardiales bacterium]|jgi:uncharacterized OsmC-like protein|nr:hypothetical protein [Pseudonocardiales bacterium]